eukprot:TRINITY_DN8366_c0_g1_i1.p1 TRINITY_DN8366_c0_g1~~TRINITY_DN8366_c0_g1_i1.p1  ORF type:complete len:260 (+),score=65.75 TRINITY_DN8366_c0_g1_i1:37-816(+)
MVLRLAALLALNFLSFSHGQEAEPATPSDKSDVLSQLTIAMVQEVVDGQTIDIRGSSRAPKQLLKMGNTALLKQGSLSEAAHEAKLDAAKQALHKRVDKQMIWWKAAPDSIQSALFAGVSEGINMTVADVWTLEGEHLPSALCKLGHLERLEEYDEELARDILSVEAAKQKTDQYKQLEDALKETAKIAEKSVAEEMAELVAERARNHELEGASGKGVLGAFAFFAIFGVFAILLGLVFYADHGRKQKSAARKNKSKRA